MILECTYSVLASMAPGTGVNELWYIGGNCYNWSCDPNPDAEAGPSHNRGGNVAYMDGHVKWISRQWVFTSNPWLVANDTPENETVNDFWATYLYWPPNGV